jgi:glyceraldehyde 3-phosphate dehydrogenase
VAVRVGINGMGRIGRTVWRVCRERSDIEVVAVNDLGKPDSLAYLMKYDSVRGRLDAEVTADGDSIVVGGTPIRATHHADPAAVAWGDVGVDVVVEATGQFFAAADARRHLDAGADRVLVSTATVDPDVTLLMGINEDDFDARRHRIVSPACCTSSCVAPVISVIRQLAGIREATLTTVHAYDATKSALLDSPHWNPRMGRAAAVNLVPARLKAGSLHALASVFPELTERMDGWHVRVPAVIGCAADLVLRMDRALELGEVNDALSAAARGSLKGYLGYTEEPIVSTDVTGAAESCIVDGNFTASVGDSVKILGWYDNEWGFASRLADVTSLIGRSRA